MPGVQVGRGVTSTGQELPLARPCSGVRGALVTGRDPAAKGVSSAGVRDPPWAQRSRGQTPSPLLSLRSEQRL